MVRAGVVKHPSEWPFSGYGEIVNPQKRYRLIDREIMAHLVGIDDLTRLSKSYQTWVEAELSSGNGKRDSRWTESLAAGSEGFVRQTQKTLGNRARKRKASGDDRGWELRETQSAYSSHFDPQKEVLSSKDRVVWDKKRIRTVS